jgi:hypothetical protein
VTEHERALTVQIDGQTRVLADGHAPPDGFGHLQPSRAERRESFAL